MDSSAVTEPDAAVSARITDEDVERARRQIGIPAYQRDVPWNKVPDASSISHFAFGIGDDNPLFHDPDYGRHTRWRGLIAPPTYLISTGIDETPKPTDPETKELFRGLFRGVGKYFSGVKWTWYAPVRPDAPVFCATWTQDVVEKQSSFSGGRSVLETYRTLYVDADGGPLATRDETYISAERGGSKKSGKLSDWERQRWDDESLAEVEAAYAAEERRGANPRFVEDVTVGEELAPLTKGPLTVVDIICFHQAFGWVGYGGGPLRYAHQLRQRMPAFFSKDRYGVPNVVQRLHWDEDWAKEIGIPAPYDYGQMRTAWLAHLLTDWVGDDGFAAELDIRVRSFNFHGDVQTCRGTVTATDPATGEVRLDVRCTNQRGEDTVTGTARVVLPSRANGPVVLPQADDDLRRRAARIVARNSTSA
ncbi:FAS1-like dehydratase domain-containing protein [Sporichthya brevicatena]|uniref:FAS1-like dehydratase domain-containing protein n=1 Tax=Sporichthya brevicatena TaxID=171442 RepID=UPI0031CF6DC7